MAWKVDAVVARPSRPASNFIVGTQRPKSRPAMEDATKPSKVPVTGSETALAPAAGALQSNNDPEPVQVPAAADEAVAVDVAATAVAVAELATVTKVVAEGAAHALAAADEAATATTAEVAAAVSVAAAVAVSVPVPAVAAVPRAEAATEVPS